MIKSLQILQGLFFFTCTSPHLGFILAIRRGGATIRRVNMPTDHRKLLCEELQRYLHSHPERAEVAQQILDFVVQTPDCFCRSHVAGHITGSAWLLSPDGSQALLTLHRKLGRWLQPGGHADGCSDTLSTALREATEESGMSGIVPLLREIYDVDIHRIPARAQEPAHLHYDIRYLLRAPHTQFCVSHESDDLAWWAPQDFANRRAELDEAVLRMARLWVARQGLAAPAF